MGRLIRALINDEALAIALDSLDIVERSRQIHNLTPVMCAALGRTLTAAAIMGARLKGERDVLTLSINGGGEAGALTACADAHPYVRGYAQNPYATLPPNAKGKLDVSGVVGRSGYITVTKDIGLKEPYTGRVTLATGEIAEDVVKYFYVSEQAPCAMALSVTVKPDLSVGGAGGLAVFPLPGASDETLGLLEESVGRMGDFAHIIKLGMEEALASTFRGGKIELIYDGAAEYRCNCSTDKLLNVLSTLGRQELLDMVEKDGGAELTCQFCKSVYRFGAEELLELINRI